MEALIDEILEDLHVPANIPILQECRTLFRKKVPLTLRSYVAAALAYRFSTSGNAGLYRQAPKSQLDSRKRGPDSREVSQRNSQKDSKKETHSDPNSNPKLNRSETPKRQAEPRHESTRENRYQGEGIILFVGAGRRQRFYARIALRMLLDTGRVTEEQIGDIRTMDNYSFINIDPAVEEAAIQILGGTEYKGRLLTVNRAKKKEDQAAQN